MLVYSGLGATALANSNVVSAAFALWPYSYSSLLR